VFARCDIAAAERLRAWGDHTSKHFSLPLPDAWKLLDERATPRDRAFLIPVGTCWTGYFDNDVNEYMSTTIPWAFTRLLGCDTYGFSDHGERGIQFRAFLTGEPDPIERAVMVYEEDGWQFEQRGEPLPFEDTEAYSRPLKRERLTEELLRTYGAALGIPFWDASAYGQDVVFLDRRGTPRADHAKIAKELKEFAKSLGGKLIQLVPKDGKIVQEE
jgi:hypothetical protein